MVFLLKAFPIITDLRQALEANMARMRDGLHIVPSGASCSIKINSSISSLPNSQFLLNGLPSKRIFLVQAAIKNMNLNVKTNTIAYNLPLSSISNLKPFFSKTSKCSIKIISLTAVISNCCGTVNF